MTTHRGTKQQRTNQRYAFDSQQLHQPRLWFITGGYLVKRWFLLAAARARGQPNDLNREILAWNIFNCRKEVINAPPVPSISRCIHIIYPHKIVWEYQWSNFIYNCMSTSLCSLQRCPPRLQRPWRRKVRITNRGWWKFHQPRLVIRTFVRQGRCSRMYNAMSWPPTTRNSWYKVSWQSVYGKSVAYLKINVFTLDD